MPRKTETPNPGYFRVERRPACHVLYLAKDGQQGITLRAGVTEAQVREALGHLPSGSHNRWAIAHERLQAAGLLGPGRRGRPLGPIPFTARGQVGAAIRRARLAAGLEVATVAAAVGVAPGTWYKWEAGQRFPPLSRLSTINDALGCKLADLIPEGD